MHPNFEKDIVKCVTKGNLSYLTKSGKLECFDLRTIKESFMP